MSATGAASSAAIVDTPEEAAAQALAPLIVRRPLEALLDAHGIGEGEVEARPIGDGHSNVTFLLRRGDVRVILRRPPRPPFQASAHDMVREARILQALAPTAVPVPEVLLVCEDERVLGVPFYVMAEVHGDVLMRELPAQLDPPEQRTAVAERMIDALVELHALDARSGPLAGFGRPEGFLERQLRRFSGIWREHRTREIPAIDAVEAWLHEHRPEQSGVALVHHDFRPANVMWAREAPARIVAVLDWELAAVGDPLCDLGWTLSTWPEAGDAEGTLLSEAAAIGAGGFPSRAELAARYAERSGRSVEDITWYTAFAFWRAATGLESFHKRALAGTTDDPFLLDRLATGVPELGERALELIERPLRPG